MTFDDKTMPPDFRVTYEYRGASFPGSKNYAVVLRAAQDGRITAGEQSASFPVESVKLEAIFKLLVERKFFQAEPLMVVRLRDQLSVLFGVGGARVILGAEADKKIGKLPPLPLAVKEADINYSRMMRIQGLPKEVTKENLELAATEAKGFAAVFQAIRALVPDSALKETEPLFVSEQDGLFGFRDKDGTPVIPAKYSHSFTETFDGSLAFVMDRADGLIAINKAGKEVLSPYFYDNGPDPIAEGLFRFVENKKIGFADKDGKIVIPARYDFATEFREGRSCFGSGFVIKQEGEVSLMKGGRWGFIDSKGATAIAPKYDEAAYFDDGKASVKENGRRVVIDKSGKEVK